MKKRLTTRRASCAVESLCCVFGATSLLFLPLRNRYLEPHGLRGLLQHQGVSIFEPLDLRMKDDFDAFQARIQDCFVLEHRVDPSAKHVFGVEYSKGPQGRRQAADQLLVVKAMLVGELGQVYEIAQD